jgi:hypothetical protein
MARKSDFKRRLRIADEAARIIVEEGIADYQVAKQKACRRLGLAASTSLPRNIEIEQAVIERQRLFTPVQHTEVLEHLRQVALSVMQFLTVFDRH